MTDRPKRPRDTNQLAKFIVDLATGEASEDAPPAKGKAAVERGKKGGRARADALDPEERAAIARKAAEARWKS